MGSLSIQTLTIIILSLCVACYNSTRPANKVYGSQKLCVVDFYARYNSTIVEIWGALIFVPTTARCTVGGLAIFINVFSPPPLLLPWGTSFCSHHLSQMHCANLASPLHKGQKEVALLIQNMESKSSLSAIRSS